MFRWPHWIALALPTLALISCGGKKEEKSPSSSAEGKEETCASYCAELDSCDIFENTGCSEDCASSSTVSRSGQEVLTDCISADICDEEVSDLSVGLTSTCLLEGLADVDLGSEATEYCETSVPAINACLGAPQAEALTVACKDIIGISSDEYLSGLNECASESCESMELCLYLKVASSFSLESIESLTEGDTDSLTPTLVGDLLATAVALMQLGIVDDLGIDLEDTLGEFEAPTPADE